MNEFPYHVFLTGASGFIGRRLWPTLIRRGARVRCLLRSSKSLASSLPGNQRPEVVHGDVLDKEFLIRAMEGTDVAYYFIHSMGGQRSGERKSYIVKDRRAAENFVKAADKVGIQRIIYLGGLGETGDGLSEHLSSRLEVAKILQSARAKTTVLRAAMIIGAGGASFDMLRYLVERLPVMICPRWVETKNQPISVLDTIQYLVGCLSQPETEDLTLDIGGPDILTYRELMLLYAKIRGLRRYIIRVPVLTPHLSSYWVNLVTPVPAGLAIPLIEGLKNELICRDHRIRDLIPIPLMSIEEAIKVSLKEIDAQKK
jgi:uncharacterized protein YbjT (DUF2867 family)